MPFVIVCPSIAISGHPRDCLKSAARPQGRITSAKAPSAGPRHPIGSPPALTHLQRLEAESIHIFREVLATADNPVLLYSIGKDSAVLLHLAIKAFYPAPLPFPLLHVDTTWKFREMIEFRDRRAKELGCKSDRPHQ